MKMTLILITLALMACNQIQAQPKKDTMSTEEREDAIRFLITTETGVFNSVQALNEVQLNYKISPDRWSVADCVKHIAAAEKELWTMAQKTLNGPPNPGKRTELKFTDADLIRAVEDRTHKSKTFEALEPENSPYKTVPDALAAYKADRGKLIAFVKTTHIDLRNHVLVLPVGTYDTYQFILLISAHSNRHIQQIEEVMKSTNFPRK